MKVHRIQARHLTRNVPSGRVMEKIGMKQEGVLKKPLSAKDMLYGAR